ncbi:MAG: methylated-DNA--[protein]-cysteine S-methyltransferase [Oscillospiraceae bacterium]|nr:methylated-DNA--[protein]-cysteine S-methyltransferase [Oscillospiraceae bacterium]
MVYKTYYKSPIGILTIASEGENLIGLWMEEQKYYGGTVTEKMIEKDDLPVFAKTKKWLDKYFVGGKPNICDLPLEPRSTEFRKMVWDLLCEIPYGELTTYGEIGKKVAKKMGKKSMSGQAVGGAVGHNPISIIIPCHRVVGSNGSLTGFAGGLEKKIKLLELEGEKHR